MRRSPKLGRMMLIALLGAAPLAAGPAPAPKPSGLAAEIDTLLGTYFAAGEPGAAVLVARGDEVILRRGYGMADLELGVPMSADHVLQVGSVSKQLTAIEILELVEAAKLALGDDLAKVVPGFPAPVGPDGKPATITVEQLLTHTSGLPNYTDLPDYLPRMREELDVVELLRRFAGKPLEFAPGSDFRYDNSGYVLLGAAIEKASGVRYDEAVDRDLLKPLALAHTRYADAAPIVRGRTPGYSRLGDRWINAPYLSISQAYAASGWMSSVDDLWRWHQALLAGKVVRRDLLDKAWTAHRLADGTATAYGYGWAISEVLGNRSVEHGGGIHGFSSYTLFVPEQRLFVAILCNADEPAVDLGFAAAQVATIVLGKPYLPRAIDLPAERLEEYTGVYTFPAPLGQPPITRTIRRQGDRLTSTRAGGPRFDVLPLGEDRFFVPQSFLQLRFERDAAGRVDGMVIQRRGAPDEKATRTGSAPPEPPIIALSATELERYEGTYELVPGMSLEVKSDGKRLLMTATGQPELQLLPHTATDMSIDGVDDSSITFVLPQYGPASGLVLHVDGRDIPANRVP